MIPPDCFYFSGYPKDNNYLYCIYLEDLFKEKVKVNSKASIGPYQIPNTKGMLALDTITPHILSLHNKFHPIGPPCIPVHMFYITMAPHLVSPPPHSLHTNTHWWHAYMPGCHLFCTSPLDSPFLRIAVAIKNRVEMLAWKYPARLSISSALSGAPMRTLNPVESFIKHRVSVVCVCVCVCVCRCMFV